MSNSIRLNQDSGLQTPNDINKELERQKAAMEMRNQTHAKIKKPKVSALVGY